MILYHGTNKPFDNVDLKKSRPNKDFGRGFYLSPNYSQAMDMAKIKCAQIGEGSPVVLTFELDEDSYKELKVLVFDNYNEEWAKFILLNRNHAGKDQAHDYDVVIGPIANDRVGAQLWRYENQMIDLPTLVNNLRYMKGVTIQYFFGTEKAISKLKRL